MAFWPSSRSSSCCGTSGSGLRTSKNLWTPRTGTRTPRSFLPTDTPATLRPPTDPTLTTDENTEGHHGAHDRLVHPDRGPVDRLLRAGWLRLRCRNADAGPRT